MIFLKIKASEATKKYYKNHGHFHDGDIGIDLYCPKEFVIKSGQRETIDFEIQCEMMSSDEESKKNIPYLLAPRGSIVKTPLMMANSIGIIDAGYRGNIKAVVYNTADFPYTLRKTTRLFQLIPFQTSGISEIILTDKLSKTERGEGGFGSTGK